MGMKTPLLIGAALLIAAPVAAQNAPAADNTAAAANAAAPMDANATDNAAAMPAPTVEPGTAPVTVNTDETTVDTTTGNGDNDHHGFPWGVVGLIGLVGLIGRLRR